MSKNNSKRLVRLASVSRRIGWVSNVLRALFGLFFSVLVSTATIAGTSGIFMAVMFALTNLILHIVMAKNVTDAKVDGVELQDDRPYANTAFTHFFLVAMLLVSLLSGIGYFVMGYGVLVDMAPLSCFAMIPQPIMHALILASCVTSIMGWVIYSSIFVIREWHKLRLNRAQPEALRLSLAPKGESMPVTAGTSAHSNTREMGEVELREEFDTRVQTVRGFDDMPPKSTQIHA